MKWGAERRGGDFVAVPMEEKFPEELENKGEKGTYFPSAWLECQPLGG